MWFDRFGGCPERRTRQAYGCRCGRQDVPSDMVSIVLQYSCELYVAYCRCRQSLCSTYFRLVYRISQDSILAIPLFHAAHTRPFQLQYHGGNQRSVGAVSYWRRGFLPRRSRSVGRVQVLPPDTKRHVSKNMHGFYH